MVWISTKESSEAVANFSLSYAKAMSVILAQWVIIGYAIDSKVYPLKSEIDPLLLLF